MRASSSKPSAASVTDFTSRGWRAFDLDPAGIDRASPLRSRSRRRARALGHELGPDHGDLAGCVDSEPDLPSLEADDRHADVVADEELFHQFPRQHEHDI